MFAMMLVFGTIVSTVSSIYEGESVAQLPFEPIWFFKSFAQRGLVNPKPNDCSFIFIVSTISRESLTFSIAVHHVDNVSETANSKIPRFRAF